MRMILVDVFVPSVDKTYDFQLNEVVSVGAIVEEISEMIEQKEHSKIVGDTSKLLLCDKDTQKVLDKSCSLSECGVTTGRSLILV